MPAAAKADANSYEDIIGTMTDEEIAALEEIETDGFEDMSSSDEFKPADVALAQETIRERLQREEDGDDFDTDETAGDGDDETNLKEIADAEAATKAEDDAKKAAADAPAVAEPATVADAAAQSEAAAPDDGDDPEAFVLAPIALTADHYDRALARADQAVEQKIADVTQKLDDMEITSEEFNAAVKAANAERRELAGQALTQIAGSLSLEAATAHYFKAYPDLNAEVHVAGMNAEFEMIDANPQYASLSDIQKIGLAHELYHARNAADIRRNLNVPPVVAPRSAKMATLAKVDAPAPAAAAADTGTAPKEAATPQLAAKPAPPKTLAKMPSSDLGQGDSSRSEQINKILSSEDPDAIEAALLSGISISDLENMG